MHAVADDRRLRPDSWGTSDSIRRRADAAFCTYANVSAAQKTGAWFSFTIPQWLTVQRAITGIAERRCPANTVRCLAVSRVHHRQRPRPRRRRPTPPRPRDHRTSHRRAPIIRTPRGSPLWEITAGRAQAGRVSCADSRADASPAATSPPPKGNEGPVQFLRGGPLDSRCLAGSTMSFR